MVLKLQKETSNVRAARKYACTLCSLTADGIISDPKSLAVGYLHLQTGHKTKKLSTAGDRPMRAQTNRTSSNIVLLPNIHSVKHKLMPWLPQQPHQYRGSEYINPHGCNIWIFFSFLRSQPQKSVVYLLHIQSKQNCSLL